jgi:hypothetical protein
MAQVQEAIAHLTLVDKLYNTGDAYAAPKTHGTSGIKQYVWNSLRYAYCVLEKVALLLVILPLADAYTCSTIICTSGI